MLTREDTNVCVVGNPFPYNNFTKLRHHFEGELNFNGLPNFSLAILTYIKIVLWSKAPPISIRDLTFSNFNNNCFMMRNLSRSFEIPTILICFVMQGGFQRDWFNIQQFGCTPKMKKSNMQVGQSLIRNPKLLLNKV